MDYLVETPLIYSETISKETGYKVYLKLECLQHTGSFKPRGALNKVLNLQENKLKNGIITASSGNHGLGVAFAGNLKNIPTLVVVPKAARRNKIEAIKRLGGDILVYGEVWNDAYARCVEIAADQGMTLIHPFDDPHIVAGQGTIALEIFNQLSDIDAITAAIGGGGLLSGVALTAKKLNKSISIIGVDAAGAPAMFESLKKGYNIVLDSVDTIADGLASKTVGKINLQIAKKFVDKVILVTDDEMNRCVLSILRHTKVLSEPSGAASTAALYKDLPLKKGDTVVSIVSGGNISLNQLANVIQTEAAPK